MPRNPARSKGGGWRRFLFGQTQSAFNPETHVMCGWTKLLSELHLTEEEARLALATNDRLGAKLRTFVVRVHRARYVPEDVLTLLHLSRESGDGSLAVGNLRRGEVEAGVTLGHGRANRG